MDIPKHVQPSRCDSHQPSLRRENYNAPGAGCWSGQFNEPLPERKFSFPNAIEPRTPAPRYYRPDSQPPLPTPAIRPESRARCPDPQASHNTIPATQHDLHQLSPKAADPLSKTAGERKEGSKKAHKESERDRREIENAHIQQLKSLTHPDCYQGVKSKYRDDAAKKEILARGDAFIMALVLRLNLEVSRNQALEQSLRTYRLEDPPTTTQRPFPNPQPPPFTHSPSADPALHPEHALPSLTPPLTHCPAPSCRYLVSHYSAWYAAPLSRRWLDGPDGVIAHATDIARVRAAGMEAVMEASAALHAAHAAVGLWTGASLVAALDRIWGRRPPGEGLTAEELAGG
ncbi:hypothetical protein MMC13_001697 [Lambiella insularis]|nr:hypothetical protein [Lambiella insularis]